jgi:hypothetical protein
MPHGSRARVELSWEAQWNAEPKRWAAGFIKRNKWRIDRIYDFDDLMQEAYLIFMRISEKYPRVVEPKNFMGLFKVAFANWFHDRAKDALRGRRGTLQIIDSDPTELLGKIGECHPDGINILLSEAPQELRLALALLAEYPDSIRAENPDGERENLNMKLRRILGLDEKFDLRAALTDLLFN